MVPKPLFNKGQRSFIFTISQLSRSGMPHGGSTDARQNYLTATRTCGERGRACGPLSNNGRIEPNRYSNTGLTTHTLLCDDNRLASAVLVDDDFPCYFYLSPFQTCRMLSILSPRFSSHILFYFFFCLSGAISEALLFNISRTRFNFLTSSGGAMDSLDQHCIWYLVLAPPTMIISRCGYYSILSC